MGVLKGLLFFGFRNVFEAWESDYYYMCGAMAIGLGIGFLQHIGLHYYGARKYRDFVPFWGLGVEDLCNDDRI
jgi:hypothetical protein